MRQADSPPVDEDWYSLSKSEKQADGYSAATEIGDGFYYGTGENNRKSLSASVRSITEFLSELRQAISVYPWFMLALLFILV